MDIRSEYLVGKESDVEWTGIFGYSPDAETERAQFGSMFGVVRMQTEIEDFYIERFAKILTEELQRAYFDNLEGYKSTLQNLEEACFKMKKRMDLISSREDDLMKIGVDMELSVAVIKDNFLYICNIGESNVFILRGDEFVNITEALVDKHQSNFFRSGSLELEKNDKLALVTSKTTEDKNNVKVLLEKLDLNELNSLDTNSGSGIMILADRGDSWVEIFVPTEEDAVIKDGLVKAELEETSDESKIDESVENSKEQDLDSFRNLENDDLEDEATLSTSRIEEPLDSFEKDESDEIPMQSKGDFKSNLISKLPKFNLKKIKKKFSDNSFSENSLLEGFKRIPTKIKSGLIKTKDFFQNNQSTYVFYLRKIGSFFASLISKIKFQFEKQILGKHMDRMYSNKQRIKRNRWILLILIVVLSIFIYTSYRSNQQQREEQKIQQANQSKLDSFNNEFKALESLVTQNKFSAVEGQKDSTLNKLNSLEAKVRAQKSSAPNTFDDKLNELINKIVKEKDELLLVDAILQPQVIADIAAEFQGVKLSDLEYAEGALFVTDEGTGNVYKLANQINSTIDVWVSNLTSPTLIVKNVANELVVYDKDESSRIGKFKSNEKNSFTRFAGLEPRNVGNIEEVAIYDGNDALYELKPNYSQIFKRDKIGDSYTGSGAEKVEVSPPNWKIDGPLSTAIDIETPGKIYVLSKGNGLLRYFGGGDNEISAATYRNLASEDFNAIKSATAIDVTALPAQNKLVIGDSENQRLLVFNIEDDEVGTLTFVKQIVFRGEGGSLQNIAEIQINGEEVFVLDGNRVLRFSL